MPDRAPQPTSAEPHAALLARIEDLEAYTHAALLQYPKLERHLLCAEIRNSLNVILRLTVTAWKRYHKKTTLQELDIEIEVLRKWLTKSLRLKYITAHRYETWLSIVNDIGRMVGGWIKSARHQ